MKRSEDNGKTWSVLKVPFAGPAAYSDITILSTVHIGCLYEAGESSPYQGIVFQRITMKEMEE